MAFKKPTVKTIDADISDLSIYLRSVKKFGKSSLAKNTILAKYGDPTKGLLVEIGHEYGDKLLDNVNSTHVDTYKDFIELKKWLIEEKGKEHDIRMVMFDVADEMVPIFEAEVVRRNNVENPAKKVKSVRAAWGGYNAGVEMAATLIKEYLSELKKAGFGVWVISHTKMKSVKEKGSLDEDGYQVLTSNLQNAYESAFGDISDLVLTGYIDRNIETVGEGKNTKRYATDEIRKLYFRGTSLIDAGSRFAPDAVPEFMVFDKLDMGSDFVKIIEEGIEKSKTSNLTQPTTKTKPQSTKPKIEEPIKVESDPLPEGFEDKTDDMFDDVLEETTTNEYPEDLFEVIKDSIKTLPKDKKVAVAKKVKKFGKLTDVPEEGLKEIFDMINA